MFVEIRNGAASVHEAADLKSLSVKVSDGGELATVCMVSASRSTEATQRGYGSGR